MNILVTGANGFIGKNLVLRLKEQNFTVFKASRLTSNTDLEQFILSSDYIFHLAGTNRGKDIEEFKSGNTEYSKLISDILRKKNKKTQLIFSSSIHAGADSSYGKTKLDAENLFLKLQKETTHQVSILKLPNVFGKWSKPNYNSVVATFCHNLANNLPIELHDPAKTLDLLYIDDLCEHLISLVSNTINPCTSDMKTYSITLENLKNKLLKIKENLHTTVAIPSGKGIDRALHATYISFLSPEKFTYNYIAHKDDRGSFAELIKDNSLGQISFFTAHPGITRGKHYHHSKVEKFYILQGKAEFKHTNLQTLEEKIIIVTDEENKALITIPGWEHEIKNIGTNTLIVALWANEVFDSKKPDTYLMSYPI